VRLFLIAGESSGDRLGAALMAGLRQLAPDTGFAGVGGPLMAAQGLDSLFPMDELSVMGLAEVLPRLPHLLRRVEEAAQAVAAADPQALITIDSPDFCLRVARRARALRPGLRTIHYVAPSVWAWRPGRAARMARAIDHVLALLPFEPPHMTAAGMGCTFVGHPVVAEPVATRAEAQAFRARHGIAAEAPVLQVLPGSRRGELRRLLPIFGEALDLIAPEHPGLRVVVPTLPGVAGMVRAGTAGWRGGPVVIDAAGEKPAAFAVARAALAASGTVSLELAAVGVPMVIAYRFNALTNALLRRMLRVDTVTLVNLVSETRAVPEFLAGDCRADRIAPAVSALLRDGSGAQAGAMARTMELLGRGQEDPGLRAARAVLAQISPRSGKP
jgi:lipid-A-disaccharide synthase